MFLKKTHTSPIGLDISDLSAKMIQLKKNGGKISMQAISKISLPEGLIKEGMIKDKEKLSSLIKKLLTKPLYGSFYGNEAVICLPEAKTYLKLITIEKGPNSINDVIASEIEKNIPVTADEIYYDWQKTKESDDHDYVLTGAAPKQIVDEYLEVLNISGLSVAASEIEAIAICRSILAEEAPNFENDKKINNYGIIDIGAKRSSLIIYSGNMPILSASMPISSHGATEEISKKLEINAEQAEKAKIICGLDEAKAKGIVSDILSDMVSRLVKKIRNGLEYYNNTHPEFGPVGKIILCGGGANIKDLDKIIARELFIDTKYGSVFTHLDKSNEKFLNKFNEKHNLDLRLIDSKKSSVISASQDSSLCYASAIGLALRNLFLNNP